MERDVRNFYRSYAYILHIWLEPYLDTNQKTLGVKEGGGKSDNNPSVAYNNNVHGVWYTMVLMKGTDN